MDMLEGGECTIHPTTAITIFTVTKPNSSAQEIWVQYARIIFQIPVIFNFYFYLLFIYIYSFLSLLVFHLKETCVLVHAQHWEGIPV